MGTYAWRLVEFLASDDFVLWGQLGVFIVFVVFVFSDDYRQGLRERRERRRQEQREEQRRIEQEQQRLEQERRFRDARVRMRETWGDYYSANDW